MSHNNKKIIHHVKCIDQSKRKLLWLYKAQGL